VRGKVIPRMILCSEMELFRIGVIWFGKNGDIRPDLSIELCEIMERRMTMKINKELMKGSTSMLLLSVLEKEEMYGYQIIKELEQRSEDVFSMNEGTLYPILHTMAKEGLLDSYWENTTSSRKRKYYRITDKGRKVLQEQKEEWKTYAFAVGKVIEAGV